jgi:ABC-type antimicrobial peptide transport system permease subunit
VRALPSPRGQAAISDLIAAYGNNAVRPAPSTGLVSFGEAVNFPLIFGLMLAVFGAATLGHLLVVSVGRRRHEMGLLKAIGFVNGQIAAAVYWQATTVALVGIVVGVPLGVVIGRATWNAFALNIGVAPVSVGNAWLIVELVACALAAVALLAVTPAIVASHRQPARLLRTE